jgi:two-component system NtrC family response regulator
MTGSSKKTVAAGVVAVAERTTRVLLVEDDPGLQRQMRWALAPALVEIADRRSQAVEKFGDGAPFRVVILDLGLPPDENGVSEGMAVLEEILSIAPETKVIVASGNVDRTNAVKAVARGAFDFFSKPVDIDVLKLIIARAERMYALEEENRALRLAAKDALPGLIHSSSKMAQVVRMIERVGPMEVSVLVTGETGTGKEIVAKALHEASPRSGGPFVAINCASIPENLLESELFGHERGAFTGAVKRTHGRFELANKGTLFLDEIGDMPIALQAKVLRFLQERKLERIGGRDTISVDVRVVSATHRKLESLIGEERFREDLYYRLNEVRVELPPLRDRETDAVVLAQHFLNAYNRIYYRNLSGYTEDALAALASHTWPGNVRELENRVKRAAVMAEGRRITATDLELASSDADPRNLNLKQGVEKLEAELMRAALARSDGNVSKAAKLLGVSRPHLYSLMRGKPE